MFEPTTNAQEDEHGDGGPWFGIVLLVAIAGVVVTLWGG
jgi:hypothetical protein